MSAPVDETVISDSEIKKLDGKLIFLFLYVLKCDINMVLLFVR